MAAWTAIKPQTLLKCFRHVQSRHGRHKAGGAPAGTWQTSHAGSTARPGTPSPAACARSCRLLSPGESRAAIGRCGDVAHPDAVSLPGRQLSPSHRSRLNRFLQVRARHRAEAGEASKEPVFPAAAAGGSHAHGAVPLQGVPSQDAPGMAAMSQPMQTP